MGCCFLLLALCFTTVSTAESQSGSRVTVSASVREEEPKGTVFANLRKLLEEKGLANKDKDTQFVLIGQQKSARFVNVTRPGSVAVAQKIDREMLCRQIQSCCAQAPEEQVDSADNTPCRLDLEVTAYVNQEPMRFDLLVTVVDRNDNAPYWPQSTHVLQVREGPKNGHVRHALPPAVDLDEPRNAVRSYRLVQQSPYEREPTFSVTFDGGNNELLRPYLQQNAALDRELRDSFNLTIEASDGENPSGRLYLQVLVADVNDNAPRLERAFYNLSVPENVDPSELLLTIRANDSDIGLNGQVRFFISEYSSSAGLDSFRMEHSTGRIFLNGRRLDYETQRTYCFLVTASDSGVPPLSATATVQINVLDVNDEVPLVQIVNGNLQTHLSVPENQAAGVKIGYVQVSDLDTAVRHITCESRTDDFQLLSNGNGMFDIRTRRTFDRETQANVNVSVICRDGSLTQSNYASLSDTVEVLDVNDNAPEFRHAVNSTFVLSVYEGNAPNVTILDALAADRDAGLNGLVNYRLVGAPSFFRIANLTGQLSVLASLDREKAPEHRFWLVASDHGSPARSVTATVLLHVLDVNDHAPLFAQSSYQFDVDENEKAGTFVGTVYATDADAEQQFDRAAVLFFTNASVEHYFDVRHNGDIFTARVFDRETQQTFNFTVFAADRGYPAAKTSSVLVTVLVNDENDNAPKFLWQSNVTISISYRSTKIGMVVAHIVAVDPDEGTNGHVLYSKVDSGSSPVDFLHIHPDSGDLVLSRPLSDDDVGLHMIVIEARDGGKVSKCDLVTVAINVVEYVRPDVQASIWDLSSESNRMRTIMLLSVISALLALAFITTSVVIVRCRMKSSHRRFEGAAPRRSESAMRSVPDRSSVAARGRSNDNFRISSPYAPVADLDLQKAVAENGARLDAPLNTAFNPWFNSQSPALNQLSVAFSRCPSSPGRPEGLPVSASSSCFSQNALNAQNERETEACRRKPHSMCLARRGGKEYSLQRMSLQMPVCAVLSPVAPSEDASSEASPLTFNEASRPPEAALGDGVKLVDAIRLMAAHAESQAFSPTA